MRRTMYIVCFFTLALFFTTIYYASYNYSLKNMNSDNVITIAQADNEQAQEAETQKVRTVNAEEKPILTTDAVCILQEHNMTNDWMTEKSYSLPFEFIGMTRDEVSAYVNQYMEQLSEEEKKVLNYELVSFSSDKIVIRKTFLSREDVNYTYWVKSVAGRLMVYLADKVTIYIRTDIEVEQLPEEEQEALKEGKYITNMQELFNYLESCTS